MNYIQMEYGLVPTKVLKDDRAEYIQALVDAREQDSLEPFRDFMFRTHLRNLQQEIAAYKQSIEDDVTIPEVEPQHVVKDVVKDVVKEKANATKEFAKAQRQIYKLISQMPQISAAQMSENMGISLRQVQRYLKQLSDQNLIVREGSRKNGIWKILDDEYEGFFKRI